MIGRLHKLVPYRLVMLLAMLCIVCASGFGQGNSPVSASVEPAQVTVGDSILYQVTVNVTGSGQPSVAVPVIDPDTGLSTPSPSGTQTSMQTYVASGQSRIVQTITYSYTIRTSKEGTFAIPPATVTLNGKNYDTQRLQVEVRPMPQAKDIPTELKGLVVAPLVQGQPELQRKLTGVVFVLPVISTTEPYNGEQVRLSYHLVIDPKALSDAGLLPRTNLDNIRIPQLSEFLAEELYPFPQDLRFQEREIGGQLFLVAPVYESVIASTKSGKLTIEPFQISMLFSLKSQSNRSRSPFANDPFLSPFGSLGMMGGNAVNVIAQSPALTLDVKPVPQTGRPADFSGAVGEFSVTAEVDKKQARAYDDTIKLNVVVEGQGNSESLSPPTLPDMPSFTVLGDPEEAVSGRKEGENYISRKSFSYTLRPTSPGTQTIPPIRMSTFDPKDEVFEKVASEPIQITVAPGSRPAPDPEPEVPDTEEELDDKPAEADFRYISTEVLQVPGAAAYINNPRAAAIFLLPLALLFGGFMYAWKQKHPGESKIDRRKHASITSSQHLKEAHRALGTGDTQAVFADLAKGIRLFFSAQLGITTGEVTILEIEDRLTRNGASSQLVSQVSNLLEACDSARYAPVSPSQKDAESALREGEQVLKDVRPYL